MFSFCFLVLSFAPSLFTRAWDRRGFAASLSAALSRSGFYAFIRPSLIYDCNRFARFTATGFDTHDRELMTFPPLIFSAAHWPLLLLIISTSLVICLLFSVLLMVLFI
jgi:hypothetical protein